VDWVERIGGIRRWSRGGYRAPYKPLLLLYALGRFQREGAAPIPYSAAEGRLVRMLEEFGPPRSTTPAYPFHHLTGDGIWLVDTCDGPGSPGASAGRLRTSGAAGRLAPDLVDALNTDPGLLVRIARSLLDNNFEPSLHEDICQLAGLELLADMDPFFGGGEMINEVHADYSTYKDPPMKFEAGTPPVAEEVALSAAIDYLQELGMEAVQAHERELSGYAMEQLRAAGARVFGPEDPDQRGGAVSFWFKDVHPHDLAQILDQEGVCVRAGHHCAQPLMRALGVPATARASFYVYNTTDDVDRLIDALHRAEEVLG
jgi:hypothetical protein